MKAILQRVTEAKVEVDSKTVGKIGTDQLEDWARRCGLSVSEAQRWLAPNL